MHKNNKNLMALLLSLFVMAILVAACGGLGSVPQEQVQEAKETLTRKKRDYVPIREVLGQFCEDVKSSHGDQDFVADEILVTRGNPVDEILAQAEERTCDIIVMGTQGHGILEDALIGSTARRVIRRSKKPVLVVRLPEEED